MVPCSTGCGAREYATALLPFIRWMTASGGGPPGLRQWLPQRWSRLWNGQLFEDRRDDAHGAHVGEAVLPGHGDSAGRDAAEDGDLDGDGEAIEDDD